VDAGVDDVVLVNKEGGSARIIFENPDIPLQAVIVAVVDGVDVFGE
jgi:microcompartment protein CcmK/EutM